MIRIRQSIVRNWSDSFDIRTNGQKHTSAVKAVDTVYRGSIEVTKYDTDRYATNHLGPNLEQGDSTLEGAEYTIYNISKADVYVNGRWIPTGSGAETTNKVITLVTDEAGHAETEARYVHYTKDGIMNPTVIYWENPDGTETKYKIDKIVGSPQKMKSAAGGYGTRFQVQIGENRRLLFLEKDKWFLQIEKDI